MTPPSPIGDDRLEALFAPVAASPSVVLAVSGGSDSTALMVLFARWHAQRGAGPRGVVVTIDHGLRAGSAQEAESVGRLAGDLGLSHRVLGWDGAKPTSDLQAAARDARYDLLCQAAREVGTDLVLTAHTRDDIAETLLIRLGRGSGLAGLAAMRERRRLDDVSLVRPFLTLDRASLRDTLRAAGIGWLEDPSNEDARFTRARVRAMLPLLAAEGMAPARLAETAMRLARAQAAIDWMVDRLAGEAAAIDPAGFARLDVAALALAPEEVSLRLFSRLIIAVGGGTYGPRLEKLEAAYAATARPGAPPARRTLAGAVIDRTETALWLYREQGREGLPTLSLSPGGTALWDGRFRVRLAAEAPGPITIAALGPAGRLRLPTVLPQAPAAARETAPAAFLGGREVAGPLIHQPADPRGCGLVMFEPRLSWTPS